MKKKIFPSELNILKEYIEKFGYDFNADIKLNENDNTIVKYFDNGDLLKNKILEFGNSSTGDIYAIWNSDENQKIIHLGSEGTDWYILANSMKDFLILLAIGYENLIDENLKFTPKRKPNTNFKKWIREKLNVNIPNTGRNISKIDDISFVKFLHETLNINEPIEEFNPNSDFNNERHYIQYRLVITSYPNEKINFIKSIRTVSKFSISELMNIKEFPFVVYENITSFNGKLKLTNFKTTDKENLINLKNDFNKNIKIEYRHSVRKSELQEFNELK